MSDYWWWKNVLSKDKIKSLNNFIIKNFDSKENPKNEALGINKEKIKFADVYCISWGKVKKFLQDPHDKSAWAIQQIFGFDIHLINNVDSVMLNIYDSKSNGSYDWHTDGEIGKNYDIKATALLNVSLDEYTGGDLHFFNRGDYVVKELKEPGSLVVFRSYFNHKVDKVLKGERRTLVMFFTGPKFK